MRSIFTVVVCVALAGCCPGGRFAGPGKVVSRSCWPFTNYQVDLEASPANGLTRAYEFSGLPAMPSVAGLSIESGAPCLAFKSGDAGAAVVRLELRDRTGKASAQIRAPFRDWIWSYGESTSKACFVYAMSTYFHPREGERYVLFVSRQGRWPDGVTVTPTLKSYAVYLP